MFPCLTSGSSYISPCLNSASSEEINVDALTLLFEDFISDEEPLPPIGGELPHQWIETHKQHNSQLMSQQLVALGGDPNFINHENAGNFPPLLSPSGRYEFHIVTSTTRNCLGRKRHQCLLEVKEIADDTTVSTMDISEAFIMTSGSHFLVHLNLSRGRILEGVGTVEHGCYQFKNCCFYAGSSYLNGVDILTQTHQEHRTHMLTLINGETIHGVLVEVDFEQWNTLGEARKRMVRGVAGALVNASKEQKRDSRTVCHLVAAVCTTTGVYFLADAFIGKQLQLLYGYELKSHTGANVNAGTAGVLLAQFISSFSVCAIGYGMGSFKDALAVTAKDVTSKTEKCKIARLVFFTEVFGNQLFSNFLSASAVAVAGLGNIKKLYISNSFGQFFVSGLFGAGVQCMMLAKGVSPLCAFIFFEFVRFFLYRPTNMAVQTATSYWFDCHENVTNSIGFFNATSPFSDHRPDCVPALGQMAITQYSVETALLLVGLATYVAGAWKLRDGVEEGLMIYAQQHGLSLQALHEVRLGCSEFVDELAGKVRRCFQWMRGCRNLLNRNNTVLRIETVELTEMATGGEAEEVTEVTEVTSLSGREVQPASAPLESWWSRFVCRCQCIADLIE